LAWNGWFYVVSQDGVILVEQNLTPDRVYPKFDPQCAAYGNSGSCAFANAAALDPHTRRIYQLLNLADGSGAQFIAYDYPARGSSLTVAWQGAILEGGSGGSVVLSPNYRNLYATDRAGNLLALDSNSGAEIWRRNIGYNADSTSVVSGGGYIMPGASNFDPNAHFVIVQDMGSYGVMAFESQAFVPVGNAAVGLDNRVVAFGLNKSSGQLQLLVIDPLVGIVSASDWGGAQPTQLVGVSLDSRGWVYVTVAGKLGLRVFAPHGH
jgi:outer membrane protein assembly factor BamB